MQTVYDVEDVFSGRCAAGKAIVESPLYPDLYVISAPYSGGRVREAALRVFVERAKPVFDDIVLDTAAGMGAPFEAACAVADSVLLVITPDPVAMRDGHIVCDALAAKSLENIRLIINRVPPRLTGCGIRDLDECIDTVGAQLIGVVPESTEVRTAGAMGTALPKKSTAYQVFSAIAARLCGDSVPLIVR